MMKKKALLAVIFLIFIILVSIIVYVVVLKRRLGPFGPPGPYYSEVYLTDYLDRYTANPAQDSINAYDVAVAMDGLDALGLQIPSINSLFQYMDQQQGADGTWNTHEVHYVPMTARILMVYARHNVPVKKSLDPFLSTVSTWENVTANVNQYDFADNYWGGLWGHIEVWVIYKHQAPPWLSDYLNALNVNFTDWAYRTHQRNHVLGALAALNEPIPQKDEVLNVILQQQNPDGGWPPGAVGPVPVGEENVSQTTETYPVISILKGMYPNSTQIENAISRAFSFIETTYKEGSRNGVWYAGWADYPGDTPILPATAGALMALTGMNWQAVTLPA